MALTDRFNERIRALFTRSPTVEKPPPLHSSVVTHDALDEGVLEEFRERAPRFNDIFDHVPELEVEPAEFDESGVETKPARTELYEPAPDLYSDVFYALHTYSEPEVRVAEECLPSRELHRHIMQQTIHSDEFQQIRPNTRFDEVGAALASMEYVETLNEQLATTLREHAERTKNMQDQEQAIEGLAGEANDIREQVQQQGGDATQEQKDELKANAQARYDARQNLESLAQEQAQQPLAMAVQEAVESATEAAQETVEAYNSLPGTGTGRSQMSPEQALEFAEIIKKHPRIHKVLELLGRVERDMRYKRTNRVIGGREEPIDVMLGDDLGLALPIETVRLRHPLLRLDFMRRLYERSILQYETIGYAEAGRGPVVVLVDISTSMGHGKLEWARAAALSIVSIAHREHRHSAAVDYNTQVVGTWEFQARVPIDTGTVLDFAQQGVAGGTDITVALNEGLRICNEHPNFKKADIVLISDGEDRVQADDIVLREEFLRRGIRVHGVGVRLSESNYLTQMCEDWVPVEDLANPSEATDHLAAVLS